MKIQVFNKYMSVALAGLFALMMAALPAQAYESLRNFKNRVEVTVKPVRLSPGQAMEFRIRLSTHSVDLNNDLVSSSVAKDDKGNEYKPSEWKGSPPGGHHRAGVLRFSELKSGVGSVTLIIKGVSGVPERTFTWKLE